MESLNSAFGALDGISPWWWIALAFALGAFEMMTMSFFLIWPALAALIMAALIAIFPGMTSGVQVISFAGLSVLLTAVGRHLFKRYGDGGGEVDRTLNQRGARFIGLTAKVLDFENGSGTVEIQGMRWRAIWPEGTTKVGKTARVTDADGTTLSVEPIS